MKRESKKILARGATDFTPVGQLAHDFNNMLYCTIAALKLIQRDAAAGRYEEIGKYAEAGLDSAHRAASLTSRLLAFGERQSPEIGPFDATAAVSPMEHGARERAHVAGDTVLVVEDETQVRRLVCEVLSDLGYETLEASDAPGALAQLENHNVDLMVSDLALPGLDGRQLADAARSRSPGLPVLFMTGCTEPEKVRSTFLDTGMDLVTKPFKIDEFAAKIRVMIAS